MGKRQRLDEEGSAEQDTRDTAVVGVQDTKIEEEKQSATWEESSTMVFPQGLPMEYSYHCPKFYVRKCYSKYYQIVLRLLRAPHAEVVTVTGTPGIGKSLFYAYFLKRFSFEAREATIIAASFNTNYVARQVAVWKGGELVDSTEDDFSDMSALVKKTKKEAKHGLIYLYDGPPNVHPVDAQAVVFTCPNDTWFRLIRKSPYRPKVIMPLWSLEELKTAAVELRLTLETKPSKFNRASSSITAADLDLSVQTKRVEQEETGASAVQNVPMVMDQVEQRFRVFGGVARECLSSSAQFVRDMQSDIVSTIQKFHDVESLRTILNQDWYQEMHDGICLYVPDPVNPRNYTVAEPTPFVKELLLKRLNKLVAAERDQIIYWLKSSAHVASAH